MRDQRGFVERIPLVGLFEFELIERLIQNSLNEYEEIKSARQRVQKEVKALEVRACLTFLKEP